MKIYLRSNLLCITNITVMIIQGESAHVKLEFAIISEIGGESQKINKVSLALWWKGFIYQEHIRKNLGKVCVSQLIDQGKYWAFRLD